MKKIVIDSISRQLSPDERLKEQVVHAARKLKYGKKTVETYIEETQSGMINTDSRKLPEGEFSVIKSRWGIYASAAAIALVISLSAVAMFGGSQLQKSASEGSGYETIESSEGEDTVLSSENADDLPEIIEMTKEEVYFRMRNSIDYFDTIQGEFIYTARETDFGTFTAFKSDQIKGTSRCEVLDVEISNPLEVLESGAAEWKIVAGTDILYVSDGEQMTKYNAVAKVYNEDYCKLFKKGDIDPNQKYDSEHFRPDSTNLVGTDMCVFPQIIAYGYLRDLERWEIDGYDTYLDRSCVILSGVTEPEYARKTCATTFQMYIDCETGTLMKFFGFDENGELSRFTLVQSIEFDAPIPEITMAELNTAYYDLYGEPEKGERTEHIE